MLISYDDCTLTFTIGGSSTGAAFVAPDDGSNLADSRTGSVQLIEWIGGTQNTGSYVEITVTIASRLDTVARIGAVGIINCSLPEGTRIVVNNSDQRLVEDARGERNAWFVPQITGNSFTVRIYNDVDGDHPFQPNEEFSIGEIHVGRVIGLCTLTGANPNRSLQDPTANTRTSAGQLYALFRKPYWQVGAQLGRFSTAQAKGGAASNLPNGAGGTIDIQRLDFLMSTLRSFAICDTPSAGQGAGTVHGAVRYDQDFMQTNWMLARLSAAGSLAMDQRPFWTWSPQFFEAT
jgi:hypothetical protein